MKPKTVVYKSNNTYCVTTEANYNAHIQDVRAIQKMREFNSAKEVVEYFCKYCGSKAENFIIINA